MDRFGPLGGEEQKTSFDDESLSSTRRADDGDDPQEEGLSSRNEVFQTKVTGPMTTTTGTTTTTTTTTTATTTTTTTMSSDGTTRGTEVQEQKLQLTPPDVNHFPFRVAPLSQVWPQSTDSKKHQDYYEDDVYYYDDEYYKDNKEEEELDTRLKVTTIDEALKYFSRERLQYNTPPEENSLGPAVPLYSLKRSKNGPHHQVRVESDAEKHHNLDPGVLQNLPNFDVPVVRVIQ